MKIYLTRHGQTKYNKKKLMQGLTDEPLNEIGMEQAKEAHKSVENVKFDAVYASPLDRAVTTAALVGNVSKDSVITDERIIEFDFGPYELKEYAHLGAKMTLYWILPEVFKCPKGVEDIPTARKRVESFFEDLKKKDYENVLIVCHGGIIRVISGYLLKRKNGIKWRPKPKNCEIRVFDV